MGIVTSPRCAAPGVAPTNLMPLGRLLAHVDGSIRMQTSVWQWMCCLRYSDLGSCSLSILLAKSLAST